MRAPSVRILAAQWLGGTLTVKPTWRLAEDIFQLHAPQIQRALTLARFDSTTVEPAIEQAWRDATSAERAEFVRNHFNELWRLADQLTAA